MKNYFPLTDYDFYAYLTSGTLTLAVLDFIFNGAGYLSRTDWSIVQIVAIVALAYVLGHITALLSQLFLETFVFRVLLTKPIQLQLGQRKANWVERTIGILIGRYYEPFPDGVREQILASAREALGRSSEVPLDVEDIFQLGFRRSFDIDGIRPRIDSFINQYGFCRNVAFVGLLALVLFLWQSWLGEI